MFLDYAHIKTIMETDKAVDALVFVIIVTAGVVWGISCWVNKMMTSKLPVGVFEKWKERHEEKHEKDQQKLDVKLDNLLAIVHEQIKSSDDKIAYVQNEVHKITNHMATLVVKNDTTMGIILQLVGVKYNQRLQDANPSERL